MIGLLCFVVAVLASPFKSKIRLEAENAVLRHQVIVLRRKLPASGSQTTIVGSSSSTFTSIDRLVFAGLYRPAPGVLDALKIVRPETVIGWHCAGFRAYWRWKSRPRGGRPKTPLEIRQLIREISLANPLWGAPRIHGELLKLGIDDGQTTVAKYMARGRRPPSQGWKTFLHNHADGIASIDLFVVPTISFPLLYGLLLLHHDRRQILWLGVTAHPTAEWISHQLTEAYGWKVAPRYIIRDRDAVYGDVCIRRLRAMAFGIGQPRRDRRGRTDIVKGRSVRSGGNVLTTLSCSASGISAICCDLTRPTITRLARTFRTTRTRHRREQYMPLVAFCLRHFSADFIICTVRQEKPDASSGRNSRLGKGNEPPHRESRLVP